MKKAILIIGLSLVSLTSINAQNQPPQTVTACEWNKWVTVYGCDGVGHSIKVEYFDIINIGKFETRHISKKIVAYYVNGKMVVQEKKGKKTYTAILEINK